MGNETRANKFILPSPQEEYLPKITERWKMKDDREVVMVDVPHNCYAVIDPDPVCTGPLKVHFDKKFGSGISKVPCWGCNKTDIQVSIAALRIGLKLL